MWLIRARVWQSGPFGELDWTEWRTVQAGSEALALRIARERWPDAREVQARRKVAAPA